MYIHHLAISAIGPFESEFNIDFSALSAAGLFLLEGPTGSGKSTIIDAIVYGLYGSVASAATSDDRMRSDHASDEVESLVDLIFETSHGIFRVVRQPERMRPKKRGTGLTKQQTKVDLYRLSVEDLEVISTHLAAGATHAAINALAVGEHRSSRADEVGLEITRAIGLSRTQFVQTIVLPQGEFAQFLRAEPEQRRQLLQNVFGTEIYERAQDQLAAMKREAAKSLEAADGARRDAIRAYVQSADNPDLKADELVAAQDLELEAVIDGEALRLEAKEQSATDLELQAFNEETAAKEALEAAKSLLAALEQRAQLEAEQARLEEQRDTNQTLQQKLASAVRASYVLPAIEAAERAQAALDSTLSEFVGAVEAAQAVVELGPIDGDGRLDSKATISVFADAFEKRRSTLETQSDKFRELRGQLAELEKTEHGLPARIASIQQEEERLSKQEQRLTDVERELLALPQQLAKIAEARDSASQRAARLPALLLEQNRLELLRAKFLQVAEQRVRGDAATLEVERLARDAQIAASEESALRHSWLGQLAGILATTLEHDAPCAVCGSVEHPAPAAIDPGSATQEMVEKAEAHRQGLQQKLSKAQSEHAALWALIHEQEAELAGSTLQEVVGEIAKAVEEVEQSKSSEQQLKKLNLEILDHETKTQKLRDQEKSLNAEIAGQKSRILQTRQHIQADQALIQKTIEDHSDEVFNDETLEQGREGSRPTIGDLAAHAGTKANAITVLLRKLDSYSNASKAHTSRQQELKETLTERQFESPEQVQQVALPEPERNQISQQVQGFEVRVASVAAQLEVIAAKNLPREVQVDVGFLKEAHNLAQNKARQASHMAHTVKKTRKDALARAQHVREVIEGLKSQRAKVQPIIRMADVASGNSSDNEKSVTLATYVLMRRFEEVVEAANARLLVLSDGRYELVRSDNKEDVRSRKMGLALQVVDHETEKPRDPRTLSGGETFNASLSLALGLADVVTAEAGGVELGTLFIDEGFGTLDPEALEKVIGVLGGLREGGRAVGVVSHVETLKQAIPDGISVNRLANGSSTLVVRA